MTAKPRSRHGLNAVMAKVKVRGLSKIDMRTVDARALIAWRGELLAALGGEEYVSPQRRALVDHAVRTKLFIDHVDNFLMAQESLVNRKKKAILPILRERQTLVDSFSRLMAQIGLERVAKPIGSKFDINWSSKDDSDQRADSVPTEDSAQPGETQGHQSGTTRG